MSEDYEYHFTRPEGDGVYTAPAEPKKKSRLGLKITALALVCALLGGAMGAGLVLLAQGGAESEEPDMSSAIFEGRRDSSVIDVAHVDTGKEMTQAEVYAANVNSTVGITTMVTTNFWGYQTQSPASGSGFIITADGYILTNYHVIEDSSTITVTTYDGTAYDATVVGYDESNDIAVLKVEAEGLAPVVLGDSDNMNVGDTVVAIGNPLGELTFSLTSGSVSAFDRSVTMDNGVTLDLLQTDCAINSGNSGGALFNLHGEVIGITNAKYSSGSGQTSIDNIGFAIPINQVKGIVSSIIERGYIVKPFIGVSVRDVSAEAQKYGLPAGASIDSVTEDSPAEKAGLQASDIITAVNGTEVSGMDDLVDIVGASAVGDELKLSVYRQGETVELTVTVGEQRQEALPQQDQEQQSRQSAPNDQQGGNGYFSFPWPFGGF